MIICHDESATMSALSRTPQTIDEIRAASGLEMAQQQSALVTLELKGLAQRLPGNRFVLAPAASFDEVDILTLLATGPRDLKGIMADLNIIERQARDALDSLVAKRLVELVFDDIYARTGGPQHGS